MSGLRIIIEESERLPNVHPGDILREDFLIGSEIGVAEVSDRAGIDRTRLSRVIEGQAPIDADLDLRLARYFGMSEGFFLGLQIDHDLEEARRAHGSEIDRIIPRAA